MNTKKLTEKYVSVEAVAENLRISGQRVRQLCVAGRFAGAFKHPDNRSGQWLIPRDYADPRLTRGRPKLFK
jgi:hypothetical protein